MLMEKKMLRETSIGFAIVLFLTSCMSQDKENIYVLNGSMTIESMQKLSQTLQSNLMIDTVELRDSLGASSHALLVMKEVNKTIYERKLHTLVKGRCASACAFAFLLGRTREMLKSEWYSPTFLFLHPIWDTEVHEIIYGHTERILDQIVERSENKLDRTMLEIIFDVKNEKGGLYVFRNAIRLGANTEKNYAYFCYGTEKRMPSDCKPISGLTPLTLGLIVHDDK